VRLRIAVYNVRGFRDGPDRVASVVRSFEPDVLLLNETGARWRLRRFADALGMTVAADPWSPLRRRAKDAVLAASPWRIAEHRQQRFSGSARFYPRAALFARLEGDGVGLWVVATHLGLRPAERRSHVEQLLASVASLRGPVIVGGDTNERPDGRAMSELAAVLPDAWVAAGDGPGETIPAREPSARIDYVFASRDVVVHRVSVPQGSEVALASDHRPVVADVELPARPVS
jgi:endonuclease/exonuclease/phosphatase family metal-dependent hydrolase